MNQDEKENQFSAEEIKNQIAKKHGRVSFDSLLQAYYYGKSETPIRTQGLSDIVSECMRVYASQFPPSSPVQVSEEAIEVAAEKYATESVYTNGVKPLHEIPEVKSWYYTYYESFKVGAKWLQEKTEGRG